jgi:nitrogen regulatory protein P-II 1
MAPAPDQDLIITIIKKGYAERIIEASREAGAEGATIMFGRGTGVHEQKKLLGIPIEPEKEIIFTVVPAEISGRVLEAIIKAGKLERPATG